MLDLASFQIYEGDWRKRGGGVFKEGGRGGGGGGVDTPMHTMRKVTINAYLRSFQYKILNNILPLNKKLYTFVLSNTNLYVLLAKW